MKKYFFSLCFAGGVLLCFSGILSGQETREDILNTYIDWPGSVENANLYQVCGFLGAKGIPIGLEETIGDEMSKYDRIVQVNNGTIREILNTLIKQESEYTWEFRDGAINIYPIRSRDEMLKSFLETRVASFVLQKGEGRMIISQRIKSLDNIQSFLKSRDLVFGISMLPDFRLENTTELSSNDTDLRGILNGIVKTRPESKRWLIKRLKNGEIFLLF